MAKNDVKAYSAALTGNGTAAGLVTVANTAGVYKKARGFLASATSSVEVEVVDVPSATTVLLRLVPTRGELPKPHYGASDMTPYTVAGSWGLYLPEQFIYEV